MHIKLMNSFGNWLITASIIQGSGMDPVTYILNDSDLHPIHQHNMIFMMIATRYSTARQSAASRSCSVCRTILPESSSRHRGGPMPNCWCVNYTGCRFNTELTTRCLCWHTRLWTRLYRSTSANASTTASTHRHYAWRLHHCSSNRSLAPTSQNVFFDALRHLSGTHFLRLSSEATHCLFSNLG